MIEINKLDRSFGPVGSFAGIILFITGLILSWYSFSGLILVGFLLAYEHSLVRPNDLSRVNTAFFTINGWISVLLLVTTAIDILCNRFE